MEDRPEGVPQPRPTLEEIEEHGFLVSRKPENIKIAVINRAADTFQKVLRVLLETSKLPPEQCFEITKQGFQDFLNDPYLEENVQIFTERVLKAKSAAEKPNQP